MCDANECAIVEFNLDRVLDLAVGFEVNRCAVNTCQTAPSLCTSKTHVASSSTMTLLSLTNARAKLSNERSPTLKFAPSLSMAVSRVKRERVETLLIVDSFTVLSVISSTSKDERVESGAIKCARRSASYNRASSKRENGSKLLRIVPVHPP